MKPLSFFSLACAILISSCHNLSGPFHLTETSLYAIDTVRMAEPGGDEKAARKKLQEATDLYRKGSDTAKSIALFKSSILLKPTAKAYFDLAGALLSTRQYQEALDALSIAEKLSYTPLANVMFRYAYAYAHIDYGQAAADQPSPAVRYMELAIQMGYAHPRQFLQKDLFPNLPKNYQFDAVYTSALSGGAGKDPRISLWDAYEGQFPETPLPLIIDKSWIRKYKPDAVTSISFQYERFIPEMRSAKFSREGGEDYYYVALIRKEAGFVALLYCEVEEMDDDAAPKPIFTLVTYDPQGKIIDKMPVAGRTDLSSPFKVFSIRPNLQFRVQEFKDVYKNDPDSAGYDSSNVGRQDPLPPVDYQIAASGKFERTAAPLAMK